MLTCQVAPQGWEEGRGLGKQQQGIATHVRVRVKADSEGETSLRDKGKAEGEWGLKWKGVRS